MLASLRTTATLVCVASLVLMSASGMTTRTAHGKLEGPARAPRLIVFVLFDTLGAGHVSHLGYGRATTPHFDALGAEGVIFEHAISPAPYAVASIPSLMTGRYPDRHGLTGYSDELPSAELTLAEHLSSAGYRTVALSSVRNGGPAFGNDQGFERFEELYIGEGPEGSTRVQFKGETYHFPAPSECLAPMREELEALGEDGSLFLFIHLLQPHTPYDPPPEYLQRFRDERFPGPYSADDLPQLREAAAAASPSAEAIEGVIHLYDSNLAWADDGLGQILAELRAHGWFDDALIIATGNHGDAFWEHGVSGHGVTLFDELMRVPMVLKLPTTDGHAGLRRTQMVSSLDLMPTILERVGLASSALELDGRSLLALLESEDAPAPHQQLFLRSEPKRDAYRKIGLRWSSEKVIVTLTKDQDSGQRMHSVELYDLTEDPGEQHNLTGSQPERAERAAQEALSFYDHLRSHERDDD